MPESPANTATTSALIQKRMRRVWWKSGIGNALRALLSRGEPPYNQGGITGMMLLKKMVDNSFLQNAGTAS